MPETNTASPTFLNDNQIEALKTSRDIIKESHIRFCNETNQQIEKNEHLHDKLNELRRRIQTLQISNYQCQNELDQRETNHNSIRESLRNASTNLTDNSK